MKILKVKVCEIKEEAKKMLLIFLKILATKEYRRDTREEKVKINLYTSYMCFSLTHMLYKILLLPFINISNQK